MKRTQFIFLTVFLAMLLVFAQFAMAISLGTFDFDDNLFGNSLTESDGGTYSSSNWLNVVNSDPGNPGYLTGPNFNTGIANIGMYGVDYSYTIGYNTAITNVTGDDLGVVVARYTTDSFYMAVSTDGTNFTSDVFFDSTTGISTGVSESYYYAGPYLYSASLYVHPIDLDDFSISSGTGIVAVRITNDYDADYTELDLIRVAGFEGSGNGGNGGNGGIGVPEPATMLLLGSGLIGLVGFRRKKLFKE